LQLLRKSIEEQIANKRIYHFVVDGFPRNQENYEKFQEQRSLLPPLQQVYVLECSLETMRRRMAGRQNEGRSDDNAAIFEKRIKDHEKITGWVLAQFEKEGLLTRVQTDKNGKERSREEYNQAIKAVVARIVGGDEKDHLIGAQVESSGGVIDS